MNKYNIDWTSPNAKKEYARLAYLKKVGKLRDEPAWHDEAYRDFRTGKYTVKELADKYKVTLSTASAMIGKKMKR
jgi:DNA-binding MarR family transcriptional regulator